MAAERTWLKDKYKYHNNLNVVNSLDQMTNIYYFFSLSQYQILKIHFSVLNFVICRIV
jgi:hypothetical protein